MLSFSYCSVDRLAVSEMEVEGPQMYEAMYNIQSQAFSSTTQQARDSGNVTFIFFTQGIYE